MSAFSFIAVNYEIPEVNNPKEKIISVKEAIELDVKSHELFPWESMNLDDKILIYEDEDDLGELAIVKCNVHEKNVKCYTDKTFIYSVTLAYSEERLEHLVRYMRENLKSGNEMEIWSIWLDDKESSDVSKYTYDEITLENIKPIFNFKCEKFTNDICIIFKG